MFKRKKKKNYHQTPDTKPCKKCAHYGTECSECEYCCFTNSYRPFERKKKKTGCETPEFRSKVPMPPVRPPKPPTSGSNAVKPSELLNMLKSTPVTVLPNDISTVAIICQYETPCGWCTKWDKKCDKKIGCENDKSQRGLRAELGVLDDVIPQDVVSEVWKQIQEYDDAMKRIESVVKENN